MNMNMRVSSDMPSQIPLSGQEGSPFNAGPGKEPKGLVVQIKDFVPNGGGVSFGQGNAPQQTLQSAGNMPTGKMPEMSMQLLSMLKELAGSINLADETGQAEETAFQPPNQTQRTGSPAEVSGAQATQGAQATNGATSTAKSSLQAAVLDNSKYSSPEALKKFAPMVAHLPAADQEKAAKELNRPIAAAKMAAAGGKEGEIAKAFIAANPALQTAADTAKRGGKADGIATRDDYNSLAKNLEKARDAGTKSVTEYIKENSKGGAKVDPQSLQMVVSAAVLRANEPITKAADPKKANGGEEKIGKYTTVEDLRALSSGNNGLSSMLTTAAKTFAQPGFSDLLDQGGMEGKELAKSGIDGDISTKNIEQWIKKQAPTNGGEFAAMMSSAATINATANVDISKLGEDVFANPANYSGDQKAAVMVKLQKTLESVEAGRSLHKTEKTETALKEKIAQLQGDKDVQGFLDKSIPEQQRRLIGNDPALEKAVNERYESLKTGESLNDEMQAEYNAATKDKDGKPLKEPTSPDYSASVGNLSAELQMQKDLRPLDTTVPKAADVVSGRPDLSAELQRSYQQNFVEGGKMNEQMKSKDAKPEKVLADVDGQKAAYDAVLPPEFIALKQDAYTDATLAALKTTAAGVSMITNFKDATAGLRDKDPKNINAQDLKAEADKRAAALDAKGMASGAAGAAGGIYAMTTVSGLLAQGKDAEAGKAIYDSVRGAGTAARVGYDLATKSSTAGGEIAGKVAGRVVGAVAGRVAGMAAASAVAAAVPVVGWIADAAMAIGFGIKAIIDAVHKKQDQKAFDHNVDPTLEQFGIPKAH
jgi:hypothetical protein